MLLTRLCCLHLWWLFVVSGCSLGVLRNLSSFFRLRCCGLVKPTIIDWTQQFPPGRQHNLAAHSDLVWPIRRLRSDPPPPSRTNQEAPQGSQDQRHRVNLLLLWEENRRSTKTAAALWTIWTNRSEAKITHGNAFVGRVKVGRGNTTNPPIPFLEGLKNVFWGVFASCIYGNVNAYFFICSA